MDVKKLRHKVQINVSDIDGNRERVVTGATMRLPARILRMLFGELAEVMVITTGRTVEGIEVREIGGRNEAV